MWLAEVLSKTLLTEDQEAYLLGRGAKPERIRSLRIGGWDPEICPPCLDPQWTKLGSMGRAEMVAGWLVFPHLTGRGELVGVDFRTAGGTKKITRYGLNSSRWCPSFFGLDQTVAEQLWQGANLWLVEGVFDLFALDWILPPGDVVLGCGRASLSRLQLDWIDRVCSRDYLIHVVFDEDEAGRRGAEGAVNPETGKFQQGMVTRLRQKGFRVQDVRYRGGKDPGEIWDHSGRAGLRSAFSTFIPFG